MGKEHLQIVSARDLLCTTAVTQQGVIREILEGGELHVGKNAFELPRGAGTRPVTLIVDKRQGGTPEIHEEKIDVWGGLRLPEEVQGEPTVHMLFTYGGVLAGKKPLLREGNEVPEEYVGTDIVTLEGRPLSATRLLGPRLTLVIPKGMPHSHKPAGNGITAALVTKVHASELV